MASVKKWLIVVMPPQGTLKDLRYWAHNCDYMMASGMLSRLRGKGWRAIRIPQSNHHESIMPSRCPDCISDSLKARTLLRIVIPEFNKEVSVPHNFNLRPDVAGETGSVLIGNTRRHEGVGP